MRAGDRFSGGSCFLVPTRVGPGTGEVVSGPMRVWAGQQERPLLVASDPVRQLSNPLSGSA